MFLVPYSVKSQFRQNHAASTRCSQVSNEKRPSLPRYVIPNYWSLADFPLLISSMSALAMMRSLMRVER